MKLAVFHGSPRKGNTYKATQIFLDQINKHGETQIADFFLPEALPEFCTGCQLCFANPPEYCPHAGYVAPILEAVMQADALVFATPHHGVSSMSAGMKNLLDHLGFLALTVTPKAEMFEKKAFVITTGTGSASAKKPIVKGLKYKGVNRVYALSIRMFIHKWELMPPAKQARCEKALRRAADRFVAVKKRHAYLSTIGMYYITKFVIKRYIGKGGYPYRYWEEKGYFAKRPF
ncbi:MAG: NAD(P)H-dependent oxidoreductase [Clostridia bacterium]|nr:NAD(P)H-dependent oxidoreductase [Clostridia bacterium]